ncbi:hypothetical protein A2875_04710 [Candidatus Gottesmanbacteria bacterium RIFCSPHIGHO2_01_FULL_46_14]|uniref:Endolytic murein transglycosylase n=3 Tax=Candidatus Gottesmaniibacteriota TaxID=1752720 RepID=A0A1F5ZJG6_9BACT|nr:MAG: Aminodeoxychorismate lyase [Candidatus Gottesmanbacteria bacterium GW2011_GWA1_47_8]OGG12474.1 MAG: hypothetical protein A2875_04710 [Candidatus Gottesmanbacteria bacterium RIFCSPHIGHO2_01_FULL_46_14]OGG28698.1 MAG: hypothetical protein A2971_03370 [Candidatus Gottesmanbacteria bacterium RIFCSPLOWO2_01_FULL_46_21]
MKSNKSTSTAFRLGVLIIVLLFTTVGVWLWWTDGTSPVDESDASPVNFVITTGEGARDIAVNLASQRLVRSSTGFFLLVKLLGLERDLQAGDYRLNRSMDGRQIARELTHGIVDLWLTTLEGWRVEEIANKLAKELDIPGSEFLKVAQEGFMFPDTYLVPRDATAAAIAKLFQDTFNSKITAQMRSDAIKSGRTLNEVIILASIVEREGRTDEDRPVIAGILWKRLDADWPLQTDATLQYALGYQAYEKSWWKKELTLEDKKIASSFNTYLHRGLPPAPISNPGLSSIRSVIYPTESPYWYYLHDREGHVHYAKTSEEHEKNIATYLLAQ